MSKGEMYSLNMTAVTAGEDIAWNDVGAPTFTTTGYEPVMGLASNHIHFIGVPGTAAGSANIYVIHCALSSILGSIFAHRSLCSLLLPT